MRAIKFRGKTVDTGKWVYGKFIDPCHICFEEIGYSVLQQDDVPIYNEYQVDKKTVGQFIGLCTGNGQEIYEGDILEYKWPTGPSRKELINHYGVYYNPDYARFELVCIDAHERLSLYSLRVAAKRGNIIGNVFDNPELVNGGNGYDSI